MSSSRMSRLVLSGAMRASRYFLATLKEAPSDAELISHKLMVRAGLIRRLAGGIYTWMPLGLRVVRKVDRKSTRLNSSHLGISYAVFCLKKKKKTKQNTHERKTE